MVQCLTIDCPIAISSANSQLLFDSVEEAKDCWKRNLPGFFLDSRLQHQDWSSLPSFIEDNLFEHGHSTLCHLPKWHFKVVLFGGRWCSQSPQLQSDFFELLSSLSSIRIMAMRVIGYGWTWQVPTTLRTYWCFSSNRAFTSFPKMQIHHVLPKLALLRPVEDFWAVLKKTIYDEGWVVTSILVLRRRIKKKARQIPLRTILCLFNTIKKQLAICAWDGYWVVHR